MQAFYNVGMIMELEAADFDPPPKVASAVLHFIRKENFSLGCDDKLFRRVVKAAFNQRRKTLRNALSVMVPKEKMQGMPYLDLRAEALSWQQFVELALMIDKAAK
jgi:16S rRNA (adenine1518-N6/adenine1519-N6)-dimethyltransferase